MSVWMSVLPSVRPSARSSIHSFVYNVVALYLLKCALWPMCSMAYITVVWTLNTRLLLLFLRLKKKGNKNLKKKGEEITITELVVGSFQMSYDPTIFKTSKVQRESVMIYCSACVLAWCACSLSEIDYGGERAETFILFLFFWNKEIDEESE